MWVERQKLYEQIDNALTRSRIAALLGPRQCGKTALARHFASGKQTEYFDLEDPTDVRRLENPSLALKPLKGLIVIDEIQRKPQLFQLLRVLADRQPLPAKFLILGSASPNIIRQTSETLAGRIEFIYMSGFDLSEIEAPQLTQLWHRGGFPLSYLAHSNEDSSAWRENFIHTFLERDLRNFGIESPPAQLRRFWTMLAHLYGQIWNAAQLATSLGLSCHFGKPEKSSGDGKKLGGAGGRGQRVPDGGDQSSVSGGLLVWQCLLVVPRQPVGG